MEIQWREQRLRKEFGWTPEGRLSLRRLALSKVDAGRHIVVLPPIVDEFNQKLIANYYADDLRAADPAAFIISIDRLDFSNLYPRLDCLVTFDTPIGASFDTKLDDAETAEVVYRFLIDECGLETVSPQGLEGLRCGEGPHAALFRRLTRDFQRAEPLIVRPTDEPSGGGEPSAVSSRRPRLVFIGRRLSKHPAYNRSFFLLQVIAFCLGYTVINLTVRTPRWRLPASRYVALPRQTRDYGLWAHEMVHASLVVSIANAGGISTTLQVRCSVAMVGRGGWVDNPKFGNDGQSMIQARRKAWPDLETRHFKFFGVIRLVSLMISQRLRKSL